MTKPTPQRVAWVRDTLIPDVGRRDRDTWCVQVDGHRILTAAPCPASAPASGPCAVPLLSQARDLGRVRCLPRDSVPELSVFKFRDAIPERVQTARTTPSAWETKG